MKTRITLLDLKRKELIEVINKMNEKNKLLERDIKEYHLENKMLKKYGDKNEKNK